MKEKWYGTEYNVFPLVKDTQIDRWTKCLKGESEWADSLHLPLQNPFVPTDFTIITSGMGALAAGNNAAAQTQGESEVAFIPTETRAMPDLVDFVTTVSGDTNDATEEEIVSAPASDIPTTTPVRDAVAVEAAVASTPVDAVDSTETVGTSATSAAVDQAPVAGTAEASGDAEEQEEEEDEESEEGPAGQLPPPQGKV
jgi:hypothetical protein